MDEARVLEERLYYERSWRGNVAVDWLYRRSSGDSETASNQPDPPYRVQSRDDLLGVASALGLLVEAHRSGRKPEAAPNFIAGNRYRCEHGKVDAGK
ncbi:uncharacterized protein TrAtP1_001352 [Trichoderma atroviride]|uniref:uncharacterized protein n=1 Tax=Hypocrea atroviridis TaxID=63577 RepID=UPI00331F98AE|nr:hypothetical protein TrAtP1_001352 [Trichoderma atroviride]